MTIKRSSLKRIIVQRGS